MFASPVLSKSLMPAFRPNAVSTDTANAHLYKLGVGDGSSVFLGQMSGFFYFKPEYTGNEQYIFSQVFTVSGQSLYIYIDKSGHLYFGFTNAGTEAYQMISDDSVGFGVWNSVFFALDSTGDQFNACSINGGTNAWTASGAASSEFGTNTYDVGICDAALVLPSGNGLSGHLSQFWINSYFTNGFGEDSYVPEAFIVTSTGMPRNLGPLGNATGLDKPTFYLPNDANSYHINNGQGAPASFDAWNIFYDVPPPTGYST